MRHNSDGLDILDKGRFESSGVRSDIVDEGKSARGEAARTRGVKEWAPLHHVKNHAEMGKAPKKTGKGRLDKYYKLAKYIEPFHLLHNRLSIPRREQCTFRVQADPAEQEILLLGIRTMLHRSLRGARGMASCCEKGAREQSHCWCVESLHRSLIQLLKKSVPCQAST